MYVQICVTYIKLHFLAWWVTYHGLAIPYWPGNTASIYHVKTQYIKESIQSMPITLPNAKSVVSVPLWYETNHQSKCSIGQCSRICMFVFETIEIMQLLSNVPLSIMLSQLTPIADCSYCAKRPHPYPKATLLSKLCNCNSILKYYDTQAVIIIFLQNIN